jgi:hypothetical protein
MSILKPKDDDIRKIHNEINQIVNQRYLITTAAITIYGLFTSILIPKEIPYPNSDLGGLVFFGTILLLILLLMLFIYSRILKKMLRIFTYYLLVTNSSNWEIDWKKYRSKGYFGYSAAQTIIFLILGLLSAIYPFGLSLVFEQKLKPAIGLIGIIIFGILYFIILIGLGFCKCLNSEKKIEQKWKSIKL